MANVILGRYSINMGGGSSPEIYTPASTRADWRGTGLCMDSTEGNVLIEHTAALAALFPALFSTAAASKTWWAVFSIKPKDPIAYLKWTPHYTETGEYASLDSDFFWNPVRQAWEGAVINGAYNTSLPNGITWIKKPSRMLYRGFIENVAYKLPVYDTSSSDWSKPMADQKIQPTNSVVRQFATARTCNANEIDTNASLLLQLYQGASSMSNYVDVDKFAALSSQEQLYTYLTLRFQEDGTLWNASTIGMLMRFRLGTTTSNDKLLDNVIDSK